MNEKTEEETIQAGIGMGVGAIIGIVIAMILGACISGIQSWNEKQCGCDPKHHECHCQDK